MKYLFLSLVLFLTSCSLNKDSIYWNEELTKRTNEEKELAVILENTLNSEYSKNRFVKILKTNSLVSTNDVINTNNCSIVICKTKYKNRVIILSAIDNLIKGGAGQAIQNMNIKYGFNETKGLIWNTYFYL